MIDHIQPSPAPERIFQRWFLAGLIVANAATFGIAEFDRSWTAFGIAMIYGPIMNGIFLVAGVIAVLVLKKNNQTMQLRRCFLQVIGGPVVICVLVSTSIFALGLHGC
jgi:hypothetical protein